MNKKPGWTKALFAYAGGAKGEMAASVVLSVLSITLGLVLFYCMYHIICLFAAGTAAAPAAYVGKVMCFTLSTGISHHAAYNILEGLRLRLVERFLHAPLGEVQSHSIGEIKNIMVDKIENIEPPLAHMIPEGAGHIVLPIVSIAALAGIDWRLALAALVTFPAALVCMMLTFVISGRSFQIYDESSAAMNSAVVEYIEGIEVIKAFGRAGVSYEKYAKSITDFRTFVIKWLSSTWVTMKLAFALFPFRCSLLENIRLGDPSATDEQVKAAARAAQCEEFIAKLPQEYDTPAGEAGKRLSGGEKQRIAIARMLLKNAPIVILDEATASIDPENEHLIQSALLELTQGKTIITIAHRLATIENADQILVVDDGRIVEQGTHAQLIRQPGRYQQFVRVREKAEGWKIGTQTAE